MVATKALVYLPNEVGPFLSGNAAKERSADTCSVKGTFYETVAHGTMLNSAERN